MSEKPQPKVVEAWAVVSPNLKDHEYYTDEAEARISARDLNYGSDDGHFRVEPVVIVPVAEWERLNARIAELEQKNKEMRDMAAIAYSAGRDE